MDLVGNRGKCDKERERIEESDRTVGHFIVYKRRKTKEKEK